MTGVEASSAPTPAVGPMQMILPEVGGAIAGGTGSFTLVFVLSTTASLMGAARQLTGTVTRLTCRRSEIPRAR